MPAVPTKLVDSAQWWVLVATVAITPLVYSRWTFDVFNVTEVTTLWVGVVLAVALLLPLRLAGRRLGRPAVWPYAAAYVAVFALATALSRAPAVSLLGIYGRIGGLATVLPAVMLAWLLHAHLARSPRRRRQLVGAIAASSILGALYLLAQELDLETHPWLEFQGREPTHPPGLLGNSNFSGAHVAMGIAPALWLAVTAATWRRAAWATGMVAGLAAVGVSQSRGAMVAAAAGLLAASVALGTGRRVVAAGAALVAAVIVGSALTVGSVSLGDLTSAATADERLELWQVALEGSRDQLLIGGGPDLYLVTFEEHAGPKLAGVVADEPHNVLLDHLDGAGLLGAAAWLALVAAVIATARASDRADIAPWAGFGAAYLTQAMLSIDAVPLVTSAWVAAAGLTAPALADRPPVAPRAPAWAVAAVVPLAVAGVLVAIQPFRADMAYRRGVEASNRGDQAAALAQFSQAVERHGWEPRYHRRLGLEQWESAVLDDERLLEARDSLERALELFPDDTTASRWLAAVERRLEPADES